MSESKTRGASFAIQALTAIDAIAESENEGSSHHGSSQRGGSSHHSGARRSGQLLKLAAGAGGARGAGAPPSASLYQESVDVHEEEGSTGPGGSAEGPAASDGSGGDASKSQRRVRFTSADQGGSGGATSRDRGLLYTAPEVLRGERRTEKADVFAFGVICYEVLSRSLLLSWRTSPPAPAPPAANSSHHHHHHHQTPGALDRSVSRSGRWAAAAATQLAARGAPPAAARMVAYVARVADGYRPPAPPFWPSPVVDLVAACTAQEPHERPRMAEVVEVLEAIRSDDKIVARLNAYVHQDVGFVPAWMDESLAGGGRGAGGGPRGGRGKSGVAAVGGALGGGVGAVHGGGGGCGDSLPVGSGRKSCDSSRQLSVRAQPMRGGEGPNGVPPQPACGCVIC